MTILNPPTPGRPDHPDFKRLDDAVKTQDMWHPRRGHDEASCYPEGNSSARCRRSNGAVLIEGGPGAPRRRRSCRRRASASTRSSAERARSPSASARLGFLVVFYYFGSKERLSAKYPSPTRRTIIEPFAGVTTGP